MIKIFLSLLLLFCFSENCLASDWENSAIKLSGDPEQRAEAIEELDKVNGLQGKLKSTFNGPKEDLALQVVQALKIRQLLPPIIQKIQTSKDSDLKTKLIIVATEIAPQEEIPQLISLYEKKLKSKVSPPVVIAFLSGLKKFKYRHSEETLVQLLDHPSYEARMAAVQAASDVSPKEKIYGDFFKKAISTSPYQVRLLAYQEFSRNSVLRKTYQSDVTKACQKEKNEEVRALCLEVGKK